MKAILICPSLRPGVERLGLLSPLAAMPMLGESLVEYWLTSLALSGITDVRVLASDRPEQIAALVGEGARWGIKAETIAESRELTPAQAQIKYGNGMVGPDPPHDIFVLDHFPGLPLPLFASYVNLFIGMFEWMPRAMTPDRVGLRELKPGIHIGQQARISPGAQLHAPCWIGRSVYIGPRAVVGPMAVIEDRCFVEPEAEIIGSLIGPDTFVGESAILYNSVAWGSTLINWKSNLCVEIADTLLLCALRPPASSRAPEGFLSRLSELYARNKEDVQGFWKHLLMNKEG